jgi:hypothetical protein
MFYFPSLYCPGPGVLCFKVGSYVFDGFIFGQIQLDTVESLYIPVAVIVDILLSQLMKKIH